MNAHLLHNKHLKRTLSPPFLYLFFLTLTIIINTQHSHIAHTLTISTSHLNNTFHPLTQHTHTMDSSIENKVNRAPAVKVGGMRVSAPDHSVPVVRK